MTTIEIGKEQALETNRQWFQIVAILLSCLTSTNFGLAFAWTSPSIPKLNSTNIHMTPEECSYFPILESCSLILTCPILAYVVERIGRKKCVLFLSFPYLLSWILTATASSKIMFYVARFCAGIGDAGVFTVLPMYIGEIAEPKVRGVWGNMVGLGIYFGQFLINVIGSFLTITETAIICAMVPTLHLITFPFMPESPYFLLMKERTDEARRSLQKLRWRKNVEEELVSLEKDVKRQISERGTMMDLFKSSVNRKALIVGIGLRLAQQFCGMPAFAVYTQNMFEHAGGNISKSTSSIVYTASLLVVMSTNMFLMDRLGRRIAMIVSSIGCGLTLLTLSTFTYISQYQLLDVSSVSWFPLFGMIIWLLFCGSGLGLVPLLMLGELFSASVKGKAINVVCVAFAVGFLSVTKIFHSLTYNFGLYAAFLFFGLCCIVILIFSYFYVPETKGKTLEEIQQILKRRKEKSEIEMSKSILKA